MAKKSDSAERELSAEEKKAAGQTEDQQAMREYHKGAFQTTDPISGEDRDLDAKPPVARLDRGETIESVTEGQS